MLSEIFFGSNNWFDDVAAPRVLPDTSAVADPVSDLCLHSQLIFLRLSGRRHSADAGAAGLELRFIGPEPVQDHRVRRRMIWNRRRDFGLEGSGSVVETAVQN